MNEKTDINKSLLDNYDLYCQKGDGDYDQKRYKDAINNYTKAIKLKPDYVEGYIKRGLSYCKQECYDKALSDVNKAIELDPQNSDAFEMRGKVFFQQNDYEQALSDFNRAIELDPQSIDAYVIRGKAFFQQDDNEKALSDFNKSIELNPNNSDAYELRGRIFFLQDDNKQALSNFNKAIELGTKSSDAYMMRGKIFSQQGNNENFLSDFNKAIELDPKDDRTYYLRGIILFQQDNNEQALSDFNKAIELNPQNSGAYEMRGRIFFQQNNKEEALSDFNKSIELDPQNSDAYEMRGIVFFQQNNKEKTLLDFNKSVDLDPQNSDVYEMRGRLFFQLEDNDKALSDFDKVIELDPTNLDVYNFKGVVYYKMKDYDSTIKVFKEWRDLLKKQTPEYKDCSYYIGSVYLKYNSMRYNKLAVSSFNEAEKDPIEILADCESVNQVEEVVYLMLNGNENCTCNQIIASIKDNDKKERYQSVYTKMLEIIYYLTMKDNENLFYAHYTTRKAAAELILDQSVFRLSSILTTNDPKEGLTLRDYLKIKVQSPETLNNNVRDYQSFIGCFSFNYKNLNQFRLYGKENSEEGTGVSIVLNENFFNSDTCANILPQKNITNIQHQGENDLIKDNKEERAKYPIYRCLYLDPESEKVISIGCADNEKNISDFDKDNINNLLQNIKNEINKNDLDLSIIIDLLLPLKFLVKHFAFKEEQECRIICIKDMNEDKDGIHFNQDYSCMYIEYLPIDKECLEKIYFGPKAKGIEIFKEALKYKQMDFTCEPSKLPFA